MLIKFADIAKEIDQDVFYLDVYPFQHVPCSFFPVLLKLKKMLFIADPEVTEYVVRQLPKSYTYGDSWPVTGRASIISLAGHPLTRWKHIIDFIV